MLRLRPCSSTASPHFAVKPKAGRRGIRRTETAEPRKSKSPVWQRGFAEIGSSMIAVGRRRAKRRTVEWRGTLKEGTKAASILRPDPDVDKCWRAFCACRGLMAGMAAQLALFGP